MPTDTRQALLLTAGVFLIFLAFAPPGIYSVDGNAILAVAESVVSGHGVSVPSELGSVGLDGRFYSNWYPLLSVLSIPTAFVARVFATVLHIPFHYLAAILTAPLSALLTSLTAGMVFLTSRKFGTAPAGAMMAAICYTFGTIALVYARAFFAEPLLGLIFIGALFLVVEQAQARQIAWAAFLAALAVLAKPTGVALGPILAAYLVVRKTRLSTALLPVAGTLVGFAAYAYYNFARFGNPLQFGQPWAFSFSNIPSGFFGLLASPEYGLLWYSPAAILALYGCHRFARSHFWETLAILALFLSQLLIHSLWQFWGGGSSWGPRFLLPALPLLFVVTGNFQGKLKKSLVVICILTFVLSAPTFFAFYQRHFAELGQRGMIPGPELQWSIKDAPLLHLWPSSIRQVRDARSEDITKLLAQRTGPATSIETSRAVRVVAIWWWVLPIAKISRWFGAVLSLIVFLWGVFFVRKALIMSTTDSAGLKSC